MPASGSNTIIVTHGFNINAVPATHPTKGKPRLQTERQRNVYVSRTRKSPAVTIDGDAFTPKTITIAHGQTVTFVNRDDEAHTVTADDKSYDSKPTRGTFQHRFTKPGRYTYHCEIHPFMHGVVIVK